MDTQETNPDGRTSIPSTLPAYHIIVVALILLLGIYANLFYFPSLAGLADALPALVWNFAYTFIAFVASWVAIGFRRRGRSSQSKTAVIIFAVMGVGGLSSLSLMAIPFVTNFFVDIADINSGIYTIFLMISSALLPFIMAWLILPVYRYFLKEKLLNMLLFGFFATLLTMFNPAAFIQSFF